MRAIGALVISVMALGAGLAYDFVSDQRAALPALPLDPSITLAESSVILASDGSVIGRIFGERRTWVNLDEMATVVTQALVAAEDRRFYEHSGVDYRRILAAAWNTARGEREGASTITMQLARNHFVSLRQAGTSERKVREMLLAHRITKRFTKQETLEWYLNSMAFGHNSFGIEAAADRFFSTSALDLSLSQAALLIGMLKGPSRYDPFSRATASKDRRNLVLRRMNELGMITLAQLREATGSPLGLNPSIYDPATSIAPHYVDYVKRVAGRWARANSKDLKRDGLVIRTTLDPRLQIMAVRALEKQSEFLQNVIDREFGVPGTSAYNRFWQSRSDLEDDLLERSEVYNTLIQSGVSRPAALAALRSDAQFVDEIREASTRLQAGFVAIDPHTGRVKAWVGGRDYRSDQFDKVASARRQPGSVFKPFVYAAALKAGFSPYYLVEDRIRTFVTTTPGERWTPTNAGGSASGRLVSLRQGLAWSKNTVSVHLISRLGPQRVIDVARSMGITSPLLPVPSLALGTSETSLLEMVNSFATFATYGVRHTASVITSIENRDAEVIATFDSEPTRALSTQTSYTMIDMMRQVIDGGTGSFIRSRFGISGDLAGKTGTTQNNADGWFIVMHPDLVVGAWVGFNDQRIAFQSNYWGQGGHNALLLVGDFLRQATLRPGAWLARSKFMAPKGYQTPKKPLYSRPAFDVGSDRFESVIAPTRLIPRRSNPLPIRPPALRFP